MRAFTSSLRPDSGRPVRAVVRPVVRAVLPPRAAPLLLGVLLAAAFPPSLAAQWPGEIAGRVVEAGSGRPVAGAHVAVEDPAAGTAATSSDAAGRFLLRGVDPGARTLRVRHPGYAASRVPVEVAAGRRASVVVDLVPAPLAVRGVQVRVPASAGGGLRVRADEEGAARTVGDLLRDLPGVVVRRRGEGAAEEVSVRGSAPDQVLVLVDGVPLNDPLTGAADVSLVPAASVEDVVLLPGARSARWGPRAQAGVVLVRTRGPGRATRAWTAVGSRGRWDVGAGTGGMRVGSTLWSVSLLRESADGSFAFRVPPEAGGGRARRENADVRRVVATATLDGPLAGGDLSVRARAGTTLRGLPGRSFAPSPRARQSDDRLQLSAAWEGGSAALPVALRLHAGGRRSHLRDPEPPTGLPWDERARAWTAGLDLEAGPAELVRGTLLRAGVEVEGQGVRADALDGSAPAVVARGGAFGALSAAGSPWGVPATGALTARVDVREGAHPVPVASHEAALVLRPMSWLTVDAAFRSAFSPPTLADQYFRAGVGVEPNPALRGERVPAEVEVGVALHGEARGAAASVRVDAYRGDVEDMIEWAPDFRFVWSPRNVDVRRRGVELAGDVSLATGRGTVAVEGGWSYRRVTYADRPDDVQLRYRPRRTGTLSLSWRRDALDLGLTGRYTGRRFPVPAPVNALPGFWTFDLALSSRAPAGGWTVEPTLSVERLLDHDDALVFGFPEPGRSVSLRVSLTPSRHPASPSERREP